MEKIELNMQQEANVHWRYEWPLKRKTRWPIHKLLDRRKKNMLKRWLRHLENLSDERKRFGRGLVDC